jgi:hypothetical protein
MYQRIQDMGAKSLAQQMSLFDSLITPITEYGSQIWGISCLNMSADKLANFELEKFHRSFLKNLLKVRKSVSSKVLLAECGREPLYFRWKRGILRYFNYLVQLPNKRVLLKSAFRDNLALARAGFPSWTHSVHLWYQNMQNCDANFEEIFAASPVASQEMVIGGNPGGETVSRAQGSPGLPPSLMSNHMPCSSENPLEGGDLIAQSGSDPVNLPDVPSVPSPEWPVGSLIESTFKSFEESCYYKFLKEHGNEKDSKARMYFDLYRRTDEGCYEMGPAPYMSRVYNRQLQIVLARFRTSCHNLQIEKGRWVKPRVERSNRLCTCCSLNVVEDETHFMFDCPIYQETRNKFRNTLFVTNQRDFQQIFSDYNLQYDLGHYIRQCEDLRTRILESNDN